MFGRIKDWRRISTRYDRCPKVFLSAIALAATVIFWLCVWNLVQLRLIYFGNQVVHSVEIFSDFSCRVSKGLSELMVFEPFAHTAASPRFMS